MPIYTVAKVYKYTETVEVEAENSREAKDRAQNMEGERNHDDYLFDCEIIAERESE
jgi:hypothetical protein